MDRSLDCPGPVHRVGRCYGSHPSVVIRLIEDTGGRDRGSQAPDVDVAAAPPDSLGGVHGHLRRLLPGPAQALAQISGAVGDAQSGVVDGHTTAVAWAHGMHDHRERFITQRCVVHSDVARLRSAVDGSGQTLWRSTWSPPTWACARRCTVFSAFYRRLRGLCLSLHCLRCGVSRRLILDVAMGRLREGKTAWPQFWTVSNWTSSRTA